MVVMEEKMVLLLLERSLEDARRDSSSGLIGVGVAGEARTHSHPPIPSLPLSGIPVQVPASGEIIQNEIIHHLLCEISRLSCLEFV